jgi:cytochrome oxidase assembly protein ShyY1
MTDITSIGMVTVSPLQKVDEQSVQPEPRAARFLKSTLVGRGPVNRGDYYEVRVMQVACANFFGNVFSYMLQWFPLGAFVGAACRSLTRAQRVFERSAWRSTSGAEEWHRCLCW